MIIIKLNKIKYLIFLPIMIFIKLNGLVLTKEKIKENDAVVYILTKNLGIIKCLSKGIFRGKSKNLSLLEPGNFNRFFLLTNLEKFKLISALPLKIVNKTFFQKPYLYLTVLKLIKNLKLMETPKFIWFIVYNLEKYLAQESKNFFPWFIYHLLEELGYGIDLDHCQKCKRKLKEFAFFDRKKFLYCFYCKNKDFIKISSLELKTARKIKNRLILPKTLPGFLKVMLKENFKFYISQEVKSFPKEKIIF